MKEKMSNSRCGIEGQKQKNEGGNFNKVKVLFKR